MRKKLVVVVEDDESIRKMLELALRAAYDVESYGDGIRADQRLRSEPAPDLLICDVMLPGIDGFEVARRAKANAVSRSVPILFLTAKDTARDVIQGIQAGARKYVTKPFELADLVKKVKAMVPP